MEDYKAQFVEIHSKLDKLMELLPNWLRSKEINPPELVVVPSAQVANDALQVFDEMPILTLVDQDEESSADNVYMPSIDKLVEGFEQQSTLMLEGLEVADNLFDELPKPKSTIEDDILEKDLLGIKVTEAAHNLLDERPMLSPVDSDLIFVGHFDERNGNNDSTPLIVCVPRVFDPGRVTTENVCPNGSSIVEIERLKHIRATVLSNMPLPSLQLISLISWSGNESINESCMNHLLDQKEDISSYSLDPVLHGCEVGQPNLLTVRSIKADDQLFDNVTERFPVEQRNGSANNGNLVLPASFPTYSGFKYDALKAVLGISSSEMMFGGMRFGEMVVLMFDPVIISWHLKSCACFYSGEIPSNLAVFIWIGKVLKVIFDPGGGYWLCMGYDLVDTNGLKHSEMLNYGQLLNRVHELLNWQLMIAVCSNKVAENRVDPIFAFVNVLPISILPTAEQPFVAHYIWCLRSYFKFCCGGFLDKNSWKVITNNVATSLNDFNYKLDDGFGLNMILTFIFDPGGSSWHDRSRDSIDSSIGEQGKRVNDVGSVEIANNLLDRLPQQNSVEFIREMYLIQAAAVVYEIRAGHSPSKHSSAQLLYCVKVVDNSESKTRLVDEVVTLWSVSTKSVIIHKRINTITGAFIFIIRILTPRFIDGDFIAYFTDLESKMLEQPLISTRGRELGSAVKGTPIDATIWSCLLKEKSSAYSYNYDALRAACKHICVFVKGHGLMFPALYQRSLHILYVYDFLSMVQQYVISVYILEDKDISERVGKWMIIMDHTTGLTVTTPKFMNPGKDHFGLQQAAVIAFAIDFSLHFQLGYLFVTTPIKVMVMNSAWLCVWKRLLDGRKQAWVLSVSTKMESFIWNPGIFCFPCSRVTLPRSYFFVFYDHGVPNAYKKSNVATILLGQAVLHWRTLFHRSFLSGFVAVHLANIVPRCAFHKNRKFMHIMRKMIGQGQYINGVAALLKSFLSEPEFCHFTTLRTRWLLRGRTCHDPRFKSDKYELLSVTDVI